MVQNFAKDLWEEGEVHLRLKEQMFDAYHAVQKVSRENLVPMRQAAHTIAVNRVVSAIQLR